MTKTMTGAERLLRLADVLDSVPVEQFTMTTWVVAPVHVFEGALDPRVVAGHRALLSTRNINHIAGSTRTDVLEALISANECGYAGCAVGWAVRDPVLQEQGLAYMEEIQQPTAVAGQFQQQGWDAVRLFFGLHQGDAEQLFSDASYGEVWNGDDAFDGCYTDPTPAEVAARIREFVGLHGGSIGDVIPAPGDAA